MSERRPSRGFTLVEMLVVISIISILAGLVLGALGVARTRSKMAQTEATIKLLEGALERYEMDFQDYPPSDGDATGIKGSERLWTCLRTEKKEGPYIQSADARTCDVNGNGDLEIADAWNRPIRYLHHRDYPNRGNPRKGTYRLLSAGPNGIYEEGAKNSDDIVNWDINKPDK